MSFELNRKLAARRDPLPTTAEIDAVTADIIRGAFETVCRFPEVAFPPGASRAPAIGPARRALEAFWRELEPLLPAAIEGTTCRILRCARDLARRRGRTDGERSEEVLGGACHGRKLPSPAGPRI